MPKKVRESQSAFLLTIEGLARERTCLDWRHRLPTDRVIRIAGRKISNNAEFSEASVSSSRAPNNSVTLFAAALLTPSILNLKRKGAGR
jgi:hypothetical protein